MWFGDCSWWRYQTRRVCNWICWRRYCSLNLIFLIFVIFCMYVVCALRDPLLFEDIMGAIIKHAVIDDKTCEERLWNMKHRGETNFYLCEINRDMVIDATYKGNKSRYINHSCCPNTEMQKWYFPDPSFNFPIGIVLYIWMELGNVAQICHGHVILIRQKWR